MTRMFQVKIGIRNIVMPGARRQTIVVMKLTRAEDRAETGDDQARAHRSPPVPGEYVALCRGV